MRRRRIRRGRSPSRVVRAVVDAGGVGRGLRGDGRRGIWGDLNMRGLWETENDTSAISKGINARVPRSKKMRVSRRNEARYAGIHTQNFTRRVTGLYQYLVGSGPTDQWDMSCGLWSVQCAHRNCIQSSGLQATLYYTVIYPFLLVKWKRYSIWSSLHDDKMDVSTTNMCLDTSIWERLCLYCVSKKNMDRREH